jgi:hypothetical protein
VWVLISKLKRGDKKRRERWGQKIADPGMRSDDLKEDILHILLLKRDGFQ